MSGTEQKKERLKIPPDDQLTGIELHEISDVRRRTEAELAHLNILYVREPMTEDDREDYRRACEAVEEEHDRLIARILDVPVQRSDG